MHSFPRTNVEEKRLLCIRLPPPADKCIEINHRQLKLFLPFLFLFLIRIERGESSSSSIPGSTRNFARGCAPPPSYVDEECFVVSRSGRSAINVANLETCRFREEA